MRGGFQAIIRHGKCVIWPMRAVGVKGLRGGPTPRAFDVLAPNLGERLLVLWEECVALPEATREECRASVSAVSDLLGTDVSGPRMLSSRFAIVMMIRREARRDISTTLPARKQAEWSYPSEDIPDDATPRDVERLFRRYAAMAEWNLIDLGKLKGAATFPRGDSEPSRSE